MDGIHRSKMGENSSNAIHQRLIVSSLLFFVFPLCSALSASQCVAQCVRNAIKLRFKNNNNREVSQIVADEYLSAVEYRVFDLTALKPRNSVSSSSIDSVTWESHTRTFQLVTAKSFFIVFMSSIHTHSHSKSSSARVSVNQFAKIIN